MTALRAQSNDLIALLKQLIRQCLQTPLNSPIDGPAWATPTPKHDTHPRSQHHPADSTRHLHATLGHADPRSGAELRDASLFIRGHRIEWVGPANALPPELATAHASHLAAGRGETIEARGHLVTPGLVNTHHHMYQSLTRAIPAVQDAELFGRLRGLYPTAGLTPEMVHVSTQTARK